MNEKLVMLIADDVEVNRAFIKAMFEEKYEILEAEDGQQTMDILLEKKVDIVILDVFMPVLDGEAVLMRMKADSRLRDIPVIAKTSMNENVEAKMLEKGADDFILLPCDPAVIINRVRILIDNVVMRQDMLKRKIEEEQHANRVKGTFIDRISKEIREDIQKISDLCDVKLMCEDTNGCEALEQISEQAEHLLTVIENVLDVSWVGAESFVAHAVPFEFNSVLVELVRSYSPMYQRKGIVFSFESADIPYENLIGDCGHLKQIWGRMLKRAYKYTQAGECVRTSFVQRKVNRHRLEIEITILGNLGVNDGYPVTKSIVELLHGTMKIMDDHGTGVGAVITLPFRIGKATVAEKGKFGGMRALVLDDNELSRNYHMAMLSRLGLSCDIAEDGSVVTQLLRNAYTQGEGYDVCFVNWYMPGAEKIIREIRSLYTSDQMIITCSTNERAYVEKQMKDAGVDYVLDRPVYQATLYQLLKQVCENAEDKE